MFLIHVATDNARISSTTFRFHLYSHENPTNFENRYYLKERVIVIPEVARFSRHLIYACNVFNSRFAHGLVPAGSQHIYLSFKNAPIQIKTKYIGEQLDLL